MSMMKSLLARVREMRGIVRVQAQHHLPSLLARVREMRALAVEVPNEETRHPYARASPLRARARLRRAGTHLANVRGPEKAQR